MQQQTSEEEDHELLGEKEDYSFQVVTQQLMRKILQYPQVRIFLLALGGILLAAIVQNGLLGPLLMIVVVGGVVLLSRRQLIMDATARWTGTLEVQQDRLVEAQAKRPSFAWVKTLDDLLLLSPLEFEKMVGDVMKQLGYTQVEVVGRSRDLCVDIKAVGPNGEQVAVQCKRYTSKNVSSDEMQKFIGMIYLHHRADKGMYFTTSSFTRDARMLGEDNHIKLINGEGLVKIIHDLAPGL